MTYLLVFKWKEPFSSVLSKEVMSSYKIRRGEIQSNTKPHSHQERRLVFRCPFRAPSWDSQEQWVGKDTQVISSEREAQRENHIMPNPPFPQTAILSWDLVEMEREGEKRGRHKKVFVPRVHCTLRCGYGRVEGSGCGTSSPTPGLPRGWVFVPWIDFLIEM